MSFRWQYSNILKLARAFEREDTRQCVRTYFTALLNYGDIFLEIRLSTKSSSISQALGPITTSMIEYLVVQREKV